MTVIRILRPQSTSAYNHGPPQQPGKGIIASVRGVCIMVVVNDPSAGSPTETLLRLLLPLDE